MFINLYKHDPPAAGAFLQVRINHFYEHILCHGCDITLLTEFIPFMTIFNELTALFCANVSAIYQIIIIRS